MTTNFDFAKAPDFAKQDKSQTLHWNGAPMQARFNGRDGKFYIDTECRDEVEIQIIDWRWIAESRFGGEHQYWLDILFADLQSNVGILPLKKTAAESMGSMLRKFGSPDSFDILPHAVWVRISSKQIEAKEETDAYYLPVCEPFRWAAKQNFDRAAAWIDYEMPENPWILTGEIERG